MSARIDVLAAAQGCYYVTADHRRVGAIVNRSGRWMLALDGAPGETDVTHELHDTARLDAAIRSAMDAP